MLSSCLSVSVRGTLGQDRLISGFVIFYERAGVVLEKFINDNQLIPLFLSTVSSVHGKKRQDPLLTLTLRIFIVIRFHRVTRLKEKNNQTSTTAKGRTRKQPSKQILMSFASFQVHCTGICKILISSAILIPLVHSQ